MRKALTSSLADSTCSHPSAIPMTWSSSTSHLPHQSRALPPSTSPATPASWHIARAADSPHARMHSRDALHVRPMPGSGEATCALPTAPNCRVPAQATRSLGALPLAAAYANQAIQREADHRIGACVRGSNGTRTFRAASEVHNGCSPSVIVTACGLSNSNSAQVNTGTVIAAILL